MIDTTARFTHRAGDYSQSRPSYPPEILAAVVEGFAVPVIADLGAGTGISSRLLAQSGAIVYAVEPNASMRAQIDPEVNVIVIDGSAEATTLRPQSIDIITAFQAFHWFDKAAVTTEAERITRPRARYAAVWNHQDKDDSFMREFDSIVQRYGIDAERIDRARRESGVLDLLSGAGWTNPRIIRIANPQPMTWEQLIGYVRSCSYLPWSGPEYDAMAREVRALFDTCAVGGRATFRWVAEAHLAERQ